MSNQRSTRTRLRLLGIALGAVLALACVSIGYALATRQILRGLGPDLQWLRSENGKRARLLADAGMPDPTRQCVLVPDTRWPPSHHEPGKGDAR